MFRPSLFKYLPPLTDRPDKIICISVLSEDRAIQIVMIFSLQLNALAYVYVSNSFYASIPVPLEIAQEPQGTPVTW